MKKMKVLSIVVPAYNSESYLHRAIDSLLTEKEKVEIIIVNDGSTDQTGEIANQYAADYPNTVRVIHKENGGHGDAVTAGIYEAAGQYLKVVDSDDWVDAQAYHQVISCLSDYCDEQSLDMLVSNYVYEKKDAWHKKAVRYRRILPTNEIFDWKKVQLPKGKYLLMHSIIFRTQLLKEMEIHLPKHTFYVDNLFVFEPMPYVKKIKYLDVDFYRYYIGREDQSVNEKKMIAQIDQQLFVNKKMIDFYVAHQDIDQACREYLFKYLEVITTVSSVLAIRSNTEENLWKKEELWRYIEQKDAELYRKLKKRVLGAILSRNGGGIRYVVVPIYKTCQKIYGFN